MIPSIVFFFVVTIGLGFLVDLLIKNWDAGFLEKIVIRIGAGVLLVPVLGVIFNHLHIPIYWPIFLALSILTAGITSFVRRSTFKENLKKIKENFSRFKIKKSHLYTFFVLILFVISAYMYIQGSFNYPWFEDGDPYGYALTSKYIALEKTYETPYYFMHFAHPYPQGYQIFMGLIHQTNNSIYWTLKFFNALIVSFSILFFFYFVKRFAKKDSIAFWSTFVLFAVPAWVSHFVFSLNFNMSLMFLIFYAIFFIEKNKKWKYLGGIFFGSIIINHFYTSVIIAVLLLIVYLLRLLVYKDFSKDYFDTLGLGFIVGLVFWVPGLIKHWNVLEEGNQLGGMNVFLPLIQAFKESLLLTVLFFVFVIVLCILYWKNKLWFKCIKKILDKKYVNLGIYSFILLILLLILVIPSEKIIYSKGSASRVYGFADFFIAQKGNMINNPIGIGIVVMILFLIGLFILIINFKKLFEEKNFYLLISLSWVIFSFIGVMGASLSIGFVPFRMWTFFGMSLSLVAGYTLYLILNVFKKTKTNKIANIILKISLILLLITAIYFTSFSQKYWHNTAVWPEHAIIVPESQQLYIWMKDGGLPKNSLVLPLCHNSGLAVGYDMLAKPWENESLSDEKYYEDYPPLFRSISLNQSVEENYQFLKKYGYEYIILGASCIVEIGHSQTDVENKIKDLTNASKFTLIKSTQTEYLFKIN